MRRGVLLSISTICLSLILAACNRTPSPTPYIYNTFASWPTMVQFAKSEADKVDKEAVVKWVFARTPYEFNMPYSPQTTPLTVEFVLLRADGEKFRIEMSDSDPPTLVALHNPWPAGLEDPPTTEYMKQLADRLSYIKVGPREVYQLTEQEGKAFAEQKNLKVYPYLDMYLEHNWPGFFGVPAGWNMHYDGDNYHNPGKNLSWNYPTLNLRIDGATGKILAREVSPADPNGTPTP